MCPHPPPLRGNTGHFFFGYVVQKWKEQRKTKHKGTLAADSAQAALFPDLFFILGEIIFFFAPQNSGVSQGFRCVSALGGTLGDPQIGGGDPLSISARICGEKRSIIIFDAGGLDFGYKNCISKSWGDVPPSGPQRKPCKFQRFFDFCGQDFGVFRISQVKI